MVWYFTISSVVWVLELCEFARKFFYGGVGGVGGGREKQLICVLIVILHQVGGSRKLLGPTLSIDTFSQHYPFRHVGWLHTCKWKPTEPYVTVHLLMASKDMTHMLQYALIVIDKHWSPQFERQCWQMNCEGSLWWAPPVLHALGGSPQKLMVVTISLRHVSVKGCDLWWSWEHPSPSGWSWWCEDVVLPQLQCHLLCIHK